MKDQFIAKKEKDIAHLEFIYDRMKTNHNENENLDYMIKLHQIIQSLKKSLILYPKKLNLKSNQRCPKHKKLES